MSVSELKQIQDVFDVQSHTHFLHTDGNRQADFAKPFAAQYRVRF